MYMCIHAALHTCICTTFMNIYMYMYMYTCTYMLHCIHVHVESATDAKNAGLLAVLLTDMLKSETVQKHVATSTRLVSVQVLYTCIHVHV